MIVWRIVRAGQTRNALSGEGAARFANRWNSKGVRMVYTSLTRPLAVLEMLTHVDRDTAPSGAVLLPVDVPDKLILELKDLPSGWNEFPFNETSQEAGDNWIHHAKSAALLVPSAVLPAERNLLLNPKHPDFPKIKPGQPEAPGLDPRVFQP